MPCAMTNRAGILDLDEFFDALMEDDIIFVGEDHDSRSAHEAELAILSELAQRDPSLVLALEMFERDVQKTLEDYLKGLISEDQFLDRARPWPNYDTDYRPLVEFAKSEGLTVIAANVPRRAAAAVAAAGEVSPQVVGEDRVYLPDVLHLDSREYYERFLATLKGMPHAGPMKRVSPDALYRAQVLKDAVMAASLEPFLDHRILFICGSFHSDYHLGTPYQLQKNHPDLKVAVVTMASSVENLPMRERSRVADFFWIED